jgi:dTDP-4-dehydrorhamnose reductase
MILLIGGSGLLGQELQKRIECYAPSHEEFDITSSFLQLPAHVTEIIHCAAYTDVAKAEIDREACWNTNVLGTQRLAAFDIPIVYISTEYVFEGGKGNYSEKDIPYPQNFYAYTKAMGEAMVRMAYESLVIRTLFKPRPYKHPVAPTDQYTTGDYVDVIAPMIVKAIEFWRSYGGRSDTIHIGTERKSTFELAKRSRPDVKPCLLSDIKTVRLPRDTSLDTTKWREYFGEN